MDNVEKIVYLLPYIPYLILSGIILIYAMKDKDE